MRTVGWGTVAWVSPPSADNRVRQLQAALRSAGWGVCRAANGVGAAQIVECRSADDVAQLAALLATGLPPTLVLVSTQILLPGALRALRECDDAALVDEPVAALTERLGRLARRHTFVDALTGLDHRQAFEQHVERALAEPPGENGVLALALLDLDHFKRINDRWGHAVGDQVLVAAGRHLRRVLGPADRCGRVGGEEFALLLRRDSLDRLRVELEGLLLLNVADVSVDVGPCRLSIGATLRSPQQGDAAAWMAQANTALYESKARGRSRLTFYEELAPAADGEDAGQALQLRHFENVTKVVTDRVANLVSALGQNLMRALHAEARRDALTGVANRGQFDRRIGREMALASGDGRPLALLFFDIDEFGRFNREHGATVGDDVLRRFAQTLSEGIRAVDWLARYGGEEFCVVMPASVDEALAAAERLRRSVENASMAGQDGRELRVTTSVGVAGWAGAAESIEGWVLRASKALQAAKRAGRNRVAFAPASDRGPEAH